MKSDRKSGADDEAAIAAGTAAKGDLTGEEDLAVLGRFEGSIDLGKASLKIEKGALVRADVRAGSIRIAGVLIGNAAASDRIQLTATARVIGDLRAERIAIEAGAQVSGAVESSSDRAGLRVPVPVPAAADNGDVLAGAPTRFDPGPPAADFDELPTGIGAERRRKLVVKVRRRGP